MRRLTASALGLLVVLMTAATHADETTAPLPAHAQSVVDRAVSLESADDLDALLESIGERPHVLLGEASHGTSEYYTWRTEISRRLITEKGFRFIAIEGDWTNAYEVNRYVKDLPGAAESAGEALDAFTRWPEWMWNNEEILELVVWLREHNDSLDPDERVGFYGIDLYTPFDSIRALASTVGEVDEELAGRLEESLLCFSQHGDGQRYAQMLSMGASPCGESMVRAYEMLKDSEESLREAGDKVYLVAKQNLRVAKNAERHYRGMLDPRIDSWNARADHFFETYDRLIRTHGNDARGIVWAHNTHIGDARQTAMSLQGQVNIGQRARERYGADNVFAVGFGTYAGTVIAGASWEAPMQEMQVPPAPPESIEGLLQSLELGTFYFIADGDMEPEDFWFRPQPHRAIGVVYNPMRENPGNYVPTILPRRYDAFIFIPRTTALSAR